MQLIGIDPGKNGCIALLDTETNAVSFYDMPTIGEDIDCLALLEMCESMGQVSACFIEHVWARPGQSTSYGFKFGVNYGIAKMVPAILKCKYLKATPQKWKSFYGLVRGKTETVNAFKKRSRLLAREMFPQASAHLSLAKHSDRAEALLMVEYMRRNML